MKTKKPKFQRTKFRAYVKLGSGQKSMQRYKKATGRHNKTRQKWKGRPRRVEIGYKGEISSRGLINGKMPILISCLNDLKNINKENIAIMANIGSKKKMEIIKEAEKNKVEFLNLNVRKFKRKMERKFKNKSKNKIKENQDNKSGDKK